jgi:tetratricopeptide (TPR) repeat protein
VARGEVKTVSVCVALILLEVLASTHCARRVAPEDLFAEGEALRLKHDERSSQQALEKYRAAVAVWQAHNPTEAARAAQSLGATYQQLGLLTDSQKAFADALAFAERSGDRLLEADLQGDLGFAQASVGDRAGALDQAEAQCRKALATAHELGGQREQAKALVCLGEVIYSRGVSFEPALAIQEEAEAIWQRIGNQSGVAQARLARG